MKDEPAVLKSVEGEAMVLRGVTAHGSVRGLLFELSVEQRYRNPHERNVEAIYTFPLPFEAVLLDLDVRIGERALSAMVVERQQAESDYEKALGNGDTAIMLECVGDGLCTLNLGNLLAGEEAAIRYRYAQLLRFEHGSVRVAVPTVIAPRYGDPASGGLQHHQVPASDLAVDYPFALTLDLHGDIATGAIASPSHRIATTRIDDGLRIDLAGASLDRDFVLEIDNLAGRSLTAIAQDGEGVVALASFCTDPPREANEAPLTVKLLVDCSGSMGGDSIAAAKRALHEILSGLQPADRFSLSRFGSTVRHETRGMLQATADDVRHAAQIISRTDADLGGTEMRAALESVFKLGGKECPADVLIITDGEIWDVGSLAKSARAAKQRVFAVGIGAAPAEAVLRRLAEATGGACEFVTPGEHAAAAIVRMFARLRAPRVTRTEIDWPREPQWVTPLPSGLFGGETVHVFAGFAAAPSGKATLSMYADDGGRTAAQAALGNAINEDRTLARVAAAHRLGRLDAHQQLALALAYGLLTERTNLLVVHERAEGEKVLDLPKLARVPQMLAAGWGGVGSVASTRRMNGVADCYFETRVLEETATFHLDFDACEIDAVTGTSDGWTPDGSRPDVRPFVAALEPLGADPSKPLPATLGELEKLGLPLDLVETLRELVASGFHESDIVAALLDALLYNVRSGAVAAAMSRGLQRRLGRLFVSDAESVDLRKRVRGRVSGSLVDPNPEEISSIQP